jgi:23S rRNA (uracil1939-C5)-methyltransferase
VAQLRAADALDPTVYAAVKTLVERGALAGVGILAGGATSNAVFGDPTEGIRETASAEENVLRVPIGGFSQANPVVNRALVEQALEWARPRGRTTLELYAGSGTMSVALAAAGGKLTTVEISADAVELAKANLEARGLKANIRCADAAEAPKRRYEVVVLDPPREGAAEALPRLLATHRPQTIVYVSCEPRTLARDLATLCGGAYRLQAVQGFDMFPQTSHVECVAWLERRA